jgi:hypothetical protein
MKFFDRLLHLLFKLLTVFSLGALGGGFLSGAWEHYGKFGGLAIFAYLAFEGWRGKNETTDSRQQRRLARKRVEEEEWQMLDDEAYQLWKDNDRDAVLANEHN